MEEAVERTVMAIERVITKAQMVAAVAMAEGRGGGKSGEGDGKRDGPEQVVGCYVDGRKGGDGVGGAGAGRG